MSSFRILDVQTCIKTVQTFNVKGSGEGSFGQCLKFEGFFNLFIRNYQLEGFRSIRIYSPVNKELLTGPVQVNEELLAGTVPVNKELLAGRVPVNNHFLFLNEFLGWFLRQCYEAI